MTIDLENFPTSEAGKRMIKSVSPIYDKSYIGKWLFQVMGLEIDEAWEYFKELRDQGFPELATWGLNYWEQLYGITTDTSKALSERRSQVIYSRTHKAPMNPTKLANLLKYATGGANFRVEENTANYTFKIYISSLPGGVSESMISAVVNKLKPAHLSYTYEYEQNASDTLYYSGIITFGKTFMIRQVN